MGRGSSNNNNNTSTKSSRKSSNTKLSKKSNLSHKTTKRYFDNTTLIFFALTFLGGFGGFFAGVYFSDPPYVRMSSIIRTHINLANQLLEHERQMANLLQEDPLIEIIKNGLRPIQERVASLRTQTSQYEKMEHISGGPTYFMSTSIKELDHLFTNQLATITIQAMQLMQDYGRRAIAACNGALDLVRECAKLHNDLVIKLMVVENVILLPINDEDRQLLKSSNFNLTLAEVTEILVLLESQYFILEELKFEAEKVAKEMGSEGLEMLAKKEEELSDEEYSRINQILEKLFLQKEVVTAIKDEYENQFKLFGLLKEQTRENIMNLLEKLKNYDHEKRNPYLKLHGMISKDIQNLKIRIQNLQYKYAKRSPEP